ncbi:MAG: hypothetical protein ACXWWU_11680 [Candidatus Limnocylindria bacterium]
MIGNRPILSTLIGVAALAGGIVLTASLLLESAEPISLARPGPGEVRPDHLPDGTPVWVIGHGDGSADVLLGFDSHRPWGLGKMLWWCETAHALDNPHHGSKWDEYGVKIGGPAPEGLRSYEVQADGEQLLIGDLRTAPPLTVPAAGPPAADREWCLGNDATVDYHRFEGWRVWDSPADAVAAAPEGWILLEGELFADPEQGRVYLCAPTGCEDRATAASLDVPPPHIESWVPIAGRFIAQVRKGELVGVSHVIWFEEGTP